MLTIGQRKAVDRARSAEAQRRRDTAYVVREQQAPYDVSVEEAHRHLDARRGRKGTDTLIDTHRGALELAYFGGYTHKKGAVPLDIPFGTPTTRTRDGQIRLRDTRGLER